MKQLANAGFTLLSRRPFVTSLICLAALSLFTVWLSAVYYGARAARSGDYFADGQLLELEGRMEEAADHYRDALSLDRDNIVYRQALVRVLIQLRHIAEAENHLVELIELFPTGGDANLMLARIAWERGDFAAAESYYQRAIYGLWNDTPMEHRTDARFEFVDRLIEAGRRNRALVELLQLSQELPADHPNNQRVASLLLSLDAPREAAELFEMLTGAAPEDAELWTGLGDSYMAMGDFTQARDAFQRAVTLDPESARLQTKLQTTRSVLNLDPNRRGLSDRERVRRSRSLIERSLALIQSCTAKQEIVLHTDEQAQVQATEAYLTVPVPRSLPEDAAETAIAQANVLWRILARVCPERDIEPGMRVVMEGLAE